MKKIKKVYYYITAIILIIILSTAGFIIIRSKSLESNLTLANKYLSEGSYDSAQAAFAKVLKRDEGNVDAVLSSGKIYLLKGDYKSAEEQFQKAININTKNKEVYIKIKDIYEENNRLDDALAIIKLGCSNTSEADLKNALEEIKNKLEIPVIDAVIKQESSYEPPKSVTIKFNNEQKELPITWSKNQIDTSKTGEFIIDGINEQYNRTAKIKLKIIPYIKTVEDINIVINQGDKYSLPNAIKAKLSDGSESDVSVIWNNNVLDTSKSGNYTFEGNTKELEKSVKLNLQVKEVIKTLNDKELLTLVTNAHNSLMKIIDEYNKQEKVNIFEFGNNFYIELPSEFNSYNKLYAHFNKYWSANASKQLLKFLDVKDRNGVYSRRFGEIGAGYFNTQQAKIVSKSSNEKKITVNIKSVDSNNEPTQYKAEVIYTEGRWLVDYWQWAFELLGS